MRSGKIVCTGRGTHKARTLATYRADEGTFAIYSQQPVLSGTEMALYVVGEPTLKRVRTMCPSCSSDLQFRSDKVHAFLMMDLPSGATRRDLSLLEAATA